MKDKDDRDEKAAELCKRTMAELERSEERLQLVLRGSNDASWDWNLESNELYYSPRWWAMLGYDVDELPADAALWKRLMHPADLVLVDQAFGGVLKTGPDTYEFEFRLRHKDCHYVPILSRGFILRDANGKPVRVSGTNTDIAERKRFEEALRFKEQIIKFASSVICTCGLEGNMTSVNHRFFQVWGFENEAEIMGRAFWEFWMVEERLDEIMAALRQEGFWCDEIKAQRKDGSLFDVLVETSVVFDSEGAPIALMSTSVDITARKRAENEKGKFEAQNRQLQKSESLGRMAGAIAHHFNNQLTGVMGNLELALGGLPRGSGPFDAVSKAMQAARHASEVSSLMLTYRGQTPGKRDPMDLAETCRRDLPMLQAVMPKNVKLETDLPCPGPVVSANANQIQQVLVNLLANAWEAGSVVIASEANQSPCVIRLSVKNASPSNISEVHRFPADSRMPHNAYACLEVVDTGCGIAENDIDNLFDPFFSTKFVGRGLGLPVVIGIVRAHEGFITVESESGSGSIFRVYFPLTSEEIPR